MLKKFIIAISLLLAFSAVYFNRPKPAAEARSYEVPKAVQEYLEYSLAGEHELLKPLLQGEALINTLANIGHQAAYGSLVSVEAINGTIAGEYEITDVKALTATYTQKGDELNELHYRFYLSGGKIFKVEPIPPVYGELSAGNRLAEKTVEEYFLCIEQNRWEDALRLLAGRAKESGRRTAGQMADLEVTFTDFTLATAGENENTSLVEARYKADGTPITALFLLTNAKGAWLIEQIIIAE